MDITIDVDAPAPLFEQLIAQIKRGVDSDLLRPGDPLPSIRQLAMDLEINAKTVAKAYRLLERDGVLQSKGCRGTFIHPDARSHAAVDLPRLIHTTLRTALDTLRQAGATDSEIRIAFSELLQRKA